MEDRRTSTAFGELDKYIAFSFSSYSRCVCSAQSLNRNVGCENETTTVSQLHTHMLHMVLKTL